MVVLIGRNEEGRDASGNVGASYCSNSNYGNPSFSRSRQEIGVVLEKVFTKLVAFVSHLIDFSNFNRCNGSCLSLDEDKIKI